VNKPFLLNSTCGDKAILSNYRAISNPPFIGIRQDREKVVCNQLTS